MNAERKDRSATPIDLNIYGWRKTKIAVCDVETSRLCVNSIEVSCRGLTGHTGGLNLSSLIFCASSSLMLFPTRVQKELRERNTDNLAVDPHHRVVPEVRNLGLGILFPESTKQIETMSKVHREYAEYENQLRLFPTRFASWLRFENQ